MNRKEMKIQLQTLQNIFRSIGLIRSGELSQKSLLALAAIEYDVISGFSQALGDNHGLLEWFIYYNEWGSRKLSVQIDDGPERVITNYDDILNVIEDLKELAKYYKAELKKLEKIVYTARNTVYSN